MSKNLPHAVLLDTERPRFPELCVCCEAAAETQHIPNQPLRAPGLPAPEGPLTFPYCNACLQHLRDWQKHSGDMLVVANLIIWGVALPLASGMAAPWMSLGPLAAIAFWYKRVSRQKPKLLENCSSSGPACKVIWYRRNLYWFSFTNEVVAAEFKNLNADSITTPER